MLVAALACGVGLAQDRTPSRTQEETVVKTPVYVRRASLGVSLSIVPMSLVREDSLRQTTTNPAGELSWSTKARKSRVGYGIVTQVVLSNRFAVAASPLIRRFGYEMDTTMTAFSVTSRQHEDTRARLIDVPVTLRFYTKSRFDPGPRGFIEIGGALRNVTRIRTQISTTAPDGTVGCCDNTPATPAHRSIKGAVAGAGLQFIDPVGVRVVPEVRYTRWFGNTFNTYSTTTQKNQVEVILSLTF